MAEEPSQAVEIQCGSWNPLAEKLADSGFRRAFLGNPQEALSGAQLSADQLPSDLLDALAELTPTELRLVGDLVNRFRITGEGPSACFF